MGTTYTRQESGNITDGSVIEASHLNNEYNQIQSAFAASTGHSHDGTAGEGGYVPVVADADANNKILVDTSSNRFGVFVEVSSSAVEQFRFQDGAIIPVTDNDIDLGTSSLEFKDAYFDGVIYTDSLALPTTTITDILDEDDMSSNSASALATQQSIKAYVDTQLTGSDLDFQADTGGALSIDLDSESLTFTGGTGIDTTGSGNAVTFAIDSTITTLSGSQTLTNKTLTSPKINEDVVVTSTATELNLLDGITAGTVSASLAVIADADKDISGFRHITLTGELDAGSLDISGDADIDGTLEADAITIGGITLAETIADTVGGMVTSNTESGITVAYDDTDNTLDFTVGTLNQDTTGNAATATALETARTIHGVSFDGTANIDLSEVISDTVGAMVTSNTESGIIVAYDDADNTLDFTVGTLNQNTTGSAATLTTARTIGGTSFDGSANIAVGLAATATALATARNIGGTSFDGTGDIAVALASVGTAVTVADESSDTTCFPLFTTAATGDLPPKSGSNLTFNSSSGLLTATLLAGDLTGDVTGNADTATLASTITATANNTTAETVYLTFVDGATGAQGIETDTGLTWNPNTNVLTAANVAGTITTAAQPNITSVGTLTGLTTTGDINLGDNDVINLGASNDLQIYHSGSHSRIADVGTGKIQIGSDTQVEILNGNFSEPIAQFTPDGAVTLYYNNSAKIATTATGATVTGTIVSDGLTVDNVLINGTTIGHTDDTDLITVAANLVTVAGEVQMTTLDIGGTNVTSTAAELNYSDLATLGSTAASKVFTADANNLTKVSGAVLNIEDTLTDGATVAWNVVNSPVAKLTMGGNRTLSAPSGTTPAAGQFISLLLIQDGTGSRTITWNAVYEFTADTAPTLTTTANLGDLFVFRYNGAKWLEVGRNLNLVLS